MRQLLLMITFSLLLNISVIGAVPPQQITWTQPNTDASIAQVLIYTLTINEEGNPVPRVVPLLNTLCGGIPAQCSTALPVNGQSAIVTGNTSRLTAKDPKTNLVSPYSNIFTGDQGCIFRDNLYTVGTNAQAQTNKQNLNSVLMEFQRAKFKHISTVAKGNNIVVTEQCVGKLVP